MRKSSQGFTIVELLIVIVVIAILASITIVAFNGIQQRARDSQRLSDASTIMKALEVYKAANGTYPPAQRTQNAKCMTTGQAHTNGYSYSDALDDTWLKALRDSNTISSVPVAPGNDCTSHYKYLYLRSDGWGCTTRTTGFYFLQIMGVEATDNPPAGAIQKGTTWKPCPESNVSFIGSKSEWIFVKDDT